jgi:ankyrin repeat protein
MIKLNKILLLACITTIASTLSIITTNAKPKFSAADLIDAARKGDTNKIQAVLNNGVNIDNVYLTNDEQLTALTAATINNQFETVKFLIEHKANVNKQGGKLGVGNNLGENGQLYFGTPIHFAAINNHIFILKYLVDIAHADINVLDEDRRTNTHLTPLFRAAPTANPVTLNYLFKKSISTKEKAVGLANKLLPEAAKDQDENRSLQKLKYLVREGANDFQSDANGYGCKALANAVIVHHLEVVKYLVEKKGVDVNCITTNQLVQFDKFICTQKSKSKKGLSDPCHKVYEYLESKTKK